MNRPRRKDRHLPARMYFRHGRHYYAEPGGKWRPLAKDLGEALQEYAAIVGTPRGSGMDKLIDRVLDHIEPTLAHSTASQYRTAGKKLKAAFLEFAPEQVKPKHVAALKVHFAKVPNMANRMLSVLRIVFAYAVEWQLVDSNPCIGIRRHAEKKRDRYLTDDEYVRIKAAANPRLALIMDVAYFTGQRISDVLKIRYADLVDAGIQFRQQKTGAKLTVRWSPELREAISKAKAASGDNVRALTVFHIRGRVPSYRGVRDLFDRAARAAEVEDAHLHDIRAKAMTDAKRQGKDPTALGGHMDARTTDRYIRLRESPQADPPSFGQVLDNGEKSA